MIILAKWNFHGNNYRVVDNKGVMELHIQKDPFDDFSLWELIRRLP